jgi:excisionase family DNA binding protein
VHYDDAMIAKILNQQHRRTARGMSYTPANVATIRRRWALPTPTPDPGPTTPEEEPVSLSEAARQLGVVPSTVYRWINDGLVPAEQLTPGAPWRIRMTDRIRALVAQDAPDGWVPVQVATRALGISRPTLLQRVKRAELRAVHIRAGRKKSLRIELPTPQDGLF